MLPGVYTVVHEDSAVINLEEEEEKEKKRKEKGETADRSMYIQLPPSLPVTAVCICKYTCACNPSCDRKAKEEE